MGVAALDCQRFRDELGNVCATFGMRREDHSGARKALHRIRVKLL